jgi:DNA invertase Pin-like site-specific DNA recombinase
MICAIYARKSTEQIGVAEDAKSVMRQIEGAKLYAAKKGWALDDALVFADDGFSGAEFERRPGFQWLKETLKRRSHIQALIVLDESRLGRESVETAHILKQFSLAGVRVFAYREDREILIETLLDKMRFAFSGLMDEGERDRAQKRTYDAMLKKASLGHVCGGRCYGYDNVEIVCPGRNYRALGAITWNGNQRQTA